MRTPNGEVANNNTATLRAMAPEGARQIIATTLPPIVDRMTETLLTVKEAVQFTTNGEDSLVYVKPMLR